MTIYNYKLITTSEKIKILEKYFDVVINEGFVFPNPTSQDYNRHFVTVEELVTALKEGSKYYGFREYDDEVHELDDLWEQYIEYIEDAYDLNTEEQIDEHINNNLKWVNKE
jgi:hypothetical protein